MCYLRLICISTARHISSNNEYQIILHISRSPHITRVVTKINGHEDKRSSKFSNLNSVNSKIAETKEQNRLKQCFS